MPNIDEDAKRWQVELAGRVGRAVQQARKAARWTALELAARCEELGYPISRVAISKIESNSRAGKIDLAELIVLAAALNTSPVNLLYPGPYDTQIELMPKLDVTEYVAAEWFSGTSTYRQHDILVVPSDRFEEFNEWQSNTDTLRQWREMDELMITRDNMDNPNHIATLSRQIQSICDRLRIKPPPDTVFGRSEVDLHFQGDDDA